MKLVEYVDIVKLLLKRLNFIKSRTIFGQCIVLFRFYLLFLFGGKYFPIIKKNVWVRNLNS